MAKSAKASFKDSVNEYDKIMRDLAAKKFSPIYLLMGEESYFIDKISDYISNNILTEGERAFNQIVAYGNDIDAGNIANYARQMPMMGGRQVVIIKEAQKLSKIESLAAYTQSPVDTTTLVICHKEKNLDKRSVLYKSINERGIVFESVKPRDYEIGGWLTDFVKSKGLAMDAKALAMLTEHLGADIPKIANELDKLLTSLPAGTTTITADHIEQNIGISKEFNNFELTKAMSEKNLTKAMTIADYFARNPKDNPIVVTISMLFTHFQRIFILNYQRWYAKKRGTQMPSDMELARLLKLPTAFFLNEFKAAAANYPNAKVFTILGLIREYDMKSKGMNVGSTDNGELLKELLLKIVML